MYRKGKFLIKQCFYQNHKMFCGTDNYSRYALPMIMLFEVGPEIRCSGESSR